MTMRNMSDGKSQTNVSVHSTTSDATEKQGGSKGSCSVHGASQTPHLDRQLQTPQSKDILQALIVSLNDIADENQCTKCAVENASTLLTGYVREVRAAKRSGQWSKEEKKALKKEIKALGRGVKRDVKKLWHEDH
ncbi:hypothetical protein BDV23DRAFT_148617 [Aspergillus alliaceus]|uniref:Uncharacterized protein n=1 Tax=Petromyces alliaceus TaxID=209559 RepID=A0A5N7CHS6_PETAA|nr:uncharacterized protein BDW43DRAFT_282938 [Aspergillus alliaceus]KAB8231150.1 hypothetical protein BDW43DRAFT_282938 [Aspergillus alliaceus]KAE8393742.1 hypothetical protein BDV23DRAFT_148617 [Aspergillus alliaceus]